MDYILEEKQKGCIFCKKPLEGKDEENFILHQKKYAYVIMNKFPYNSGHLMVVPIRHCPGLEELNDKELKELFYLLKASTQILKKSLHPQGFNIGINIGKVGGAGVDEHIHFHIVPRWTGDTNFMPVFGETKIIPEYLGITYRILRPGFEDLRAPKRRRKGGRKK